MDPAAFLGYWIGTFFIGSHESSFIISWSGCSSCELNVLSQAICALKLSGSDYDSNRCCDTTTPESIHTKDESKHGTAFAFIFNIYIYISILLTFFDINKMHMSLIRKLALAEAIT